MKRMVCRAKTEGIESLQRHHRIDTIPMKIKEAAVEDYLNGKGSLTEICIKYKNQRILSSEDGFHGIIMARDLKSINAQKEDLP